MPLQRRRHGRSRQGKDRAHKKLEQPTTIPCESCGAPKRPHRVCAKCGEYKKAKVKAPVEA